MYTRWSFKKIVVRTPIDVLTICFAQLYKFEFPPVSNSPNLNLKQTRLGRDQSQRFMPAVSLYYQDEYATIELDESVPCVKLKLDGMPRFSEHYQMVQSKRLDCMREGMKRHKLLHMLTDSRAAGPVLEEDVSYFREHVMPEMERSGVRYLAIVMPSNVFTRMTIKDMTGNTSIINVRYFDSIREAREWLKSKSPELL